MATDPELQEKNSLQNRHPHFEPARHADSADAATQVVQLATGYWFSRCLQVVAEIGVADALSDAPRPAADLAQAVGADPDSLHRVLRLLSSQGVFAVAEGGYSIRRFHACSAAIIRIPFAPTCAWLAVRFSGTATPKSNTSSAPDKPV